ncbi:YraN family protein [Thalassotalea aquiviva]|uniref:YraN family protein n=1 Tax=Thalassotalea aquiviva TaxID=3242415 RepID=UPI00352A8153
MALDYLYRQQLKLKQMNFSCRQGEIDIIALDGDVLVFIEVKYRKNTAYGAPEAMVSPKKQQKIIKTAKFYLQKQGLNEYNTECRFDVVSILGPSTAPTITWLKDAFYGV